MKDFVKQHRLSQRRSMPITGNITVLEFSFIFAISAADAFITFLSFSPTVTSRLVLVCLSESGIVQVILVFDKAYLHSIDSFLYSMFRIGWHEDKAFLPEPGKIKTAPQLLKMADLFFPHQAADTPAMNKNQKLRMLCTRFCYMKFNILPHPSPYFAVYQKPYIEKNAKQSESHTKKADIRTRRESDI
ncbi:hypothetical protein [Bacillus halotolerans]|uniref:hypothetical protein n=1 Tax=Bacillus halotolerans TaxID=260554 RepID=UPI0005C4BFC1|nr:hypothetical protein [Bacillus halotolerans]MDG0766505.1 hypothetical protein [Bacillus halotolerans]MDG3074534.1 hypothetical protein [Bacillus halotolerans]UYO30958.1 hypothetical protein NDR85_14500 [Bacillus halotolerans]